MKGNRPLRLASAAQAPTIASSMPRRTAALVLWSALLLCAPVPFSLVERGHQPVAALVELIGVTLVLMAAEGGGGAAPLVAAMLTVQALLAAFVFGLLSLAAAGFLERRLGDRAPGVAAMLAVAMLAIALFLPIYRTPFRGGGLQATLAEVFE
jgi:hypothetical protein